MSFTKTPDAIVDGRQGRSSTFTDWKEPGSGALIAQSLLDRRVAGRKPRPSRRPLARRSPGAHGPRELGEHRDRHLPAHAGVGDALAVAQRGWVGQLLAAVDEKALHHHAEDCGLAVGDLLGDVAPGDRLAAVVLVAVAVARVDHEPRRKPSVDERRGRLLHAHGVVVGTARAPAQDDVAIGVTARGDNRAEPLLGHAGELVGMPGGAHGVDGDLDAAVGAVLEADGHREARGQLAVHLALGRARADGAPGDEVRGELGRDRIEELAARGQPELGEIEQEAARPPEPVVDGEAPVEAGVVDEPLPAHGGPRLLEVDAHHDTEIALVLVPHGLEPPCVVEGRGRVVDRTRADDDDEPIVFAPEDAADLLARPRHGLGAVVAERLFLEQDQRRQERSEALDAQVAGTFRHGAQCTREGAPDQRPRHATLRPAVDRLADLERIQKKVLWLGTYMVHHANSLRPNLDGVKVGGHQASSSSIVSLLTALYFDALRPDDLVAVKAHASPAFYAIQYLRGRLTPAALRELPSFGCPP